MPDDVEIRWASSDGEARTAHDLFLRRIGRSLVEDAHSFIVSATADGANWLPRLGLALVDGHLAAAQLGGLLPAVGLLSLPYTAVAEPFEGRGVYRRLKQAMLARLRDDALARGLPEPTGNISEERPGSAQFRRKVEGGFAVVLPVAYLAPATQGLAETPLALTYEALTAAPPPFTPAELRAVVAAIYRGLYRIDEPERDPSFQRTVASIG